MPIIRVEMWEGRTKEQKRELVKVLSKETARITGCGMDSIYVVIDDVKKENRGAFFTAEEKTCTLLHNCLKGPSYY